MKTLYVCNGKMDCHLRKDGKVNEFCKNDPNGIEGCYYTTNKDYALYKEHKNFIEKPDMGIRVEERK
jgi:hypothetical protein